MYLELVDVIEQKCFMVDIITVEIRSKGFVNQEGLHEKTKHSALDINLRHSKTVGLCNNHHFQVFGNNIVPI